MGNAIETRRTQLQLRKIMVKIATWNLCLGLANKKEYVVSTIKKEEIDICMMQETEIKRDYDIKLLTLILHSIQRENLLSAVRRFQPR